MKNLFLIGLPILLLLLGLFSFCKGVEKEVPQTTLKKDYTEEIIFIGHSYKWRRYPTEKSNKIDPRIEQLDLQRYSQIWLGGDLCGVTSEFPTTIDYLDSLFDLGATQTHWAWGNHDIHKGTPAFIQKATKRKSFYSYTKDNLSVLVLNTNIYNKKQAFSTYGDSNCTMMDEQYQLIKQVCDTIQKSKYLVILHHHCLATNFLLKKRANVYNEFNFVNAQLDFACHPQGSFTEIIYPLLKKPQQRGVQVILVGGDLGQKSKKFECQTNDKIWFLGSGINNSMPKAVRPEYVTNINPDSILIFEYSHPAEKLTWDFRPLNDLPKK